MSPTQILTRRKPHISKGSSRSCCQVPDGSANVCRLHCLLCRQTDHDSFKGLIVALLYEPLFSWVVLHFLSKKWLKSAKPLYLSFVNNNYNAYNCRQMTTFSSRSLIGSARSSLRLGSLPAFLSVIICTISTKSVLNYLTCSIAISIIPNFKLQENESNLVLGSLYI